MLAKTILQIKYTNEACHSNGTSGNTMPAKQTGLVEAAKVPACVLVALVSAAPHRKAIAAKTADQREEPPPTDSISH